MRPRVAPGPPAGRPDFDSPEYAEWWERRKRWALERGESVALLIIAERTLKARWSAERAA